MAFGVRLWSKNIGLDLGTANVVISIAGQGIALREPAMVAVKVEPRRQVVAVGEDAKTMLGRTPEAIRAVKPMNEGVIADFDAAQLMIKYLLQKANDFSVPIFKPRVVVCVPYSITPVERRAVLEAVRNAGARSVHIVVEPMAAAIGAGLPVGAAKGCMVVDIGGGTSEIAVISMNGIVTASSVRCGGQKMDEAIINYLRSEYNLLVGERTAEEVKIGIGSAISTRRRETAQVHGRDLITGLPHTVEITNEQITEALHEPLSIIMNALRSCLENTPPEIAADIMESGIYLTGGGALLSGMDILVANATGMPVALSEQPLDCVALGAGILAADMPRLRAITSQAEDWK
ncbi:MAG: rod shape-determining protein [Christensenellaceae bacterium]|jgi:rod shape-determining protein MreB|nr:rod shape-determining protein [Christensenellaceae bacterium]